LKKSIKYAGIAAATLLAVAPIAAPALSTVSTTVKAATSSELATNLANAKADQKSANDTLADVQANGKAKADSAAAVGTMQKGLADAKAITPADDAAVKDANSAVTAAQKALDVVTGETDYLSDATVQKTALDKFNGQFGDQDASTFAKNTYLGSVKDLTSGNQYTYTDFMNSGVAHFLNNDANNSAAIELGSGLYNGVSVNYDNALNQANGSAKAGNMKNIYVTAKAGSNTITNQTELRNVLNDNTQPNVVFTINYTYTNTEGKDQTGSTTVTATRSNLSMTKVSANFTTPYKVALNQTVTDSKLISATDFSIVDQDGKSLLTDSDAVPSDSYYHTASGALNDTNAINDDSIIETNSSTEFLPCLKRCNF